MRGLRKLRPLKLPRRARKGEVVKTGILLLLVGAGMGAVSSAIAVRRFLDV